MALENMSIEEEADAEIKINVVKRKLEKMSIEDLNRKSDDAWFEEKLDYLVQSPAFEVEGSIMIMTTHGPAINLDAIPPAPTSMYPKPNNHHCHIAGAAVQELWRLVQDNALWTKDVINGTDVLQIPNYELGQNKIPNSRTEASRAFADVKMDAKQLALMMINGNWSELFPSMVLNTTTIDVLSRGSSLDNPNGSLHLMYKELHLTSPLVPNRRFLFLRTCTKVDESSWLVADISVKPSKNVGNQSICHRLPSGCLIRGIAQGLSQVTWVEHLEIEGPLQDYMLYNGHVKEYGMRQEPRLHGIWRRNL